MISVFDSTEALALNKARMEHLESFHLSLAGKRVLDLGCGVGHLASFLVERLKCKVTATDARPENVNKAAYNLSRGDLAGRSWNIYDIEDRHSLFDPPRFDGVFCYGLLYHLQNPLAALSRMAELTKDILLLETIVLDSPDMLVKYESEDKTNPNQAITGLGCRPSRVLLRAKLRELFPYVYYPKRQPEHPDFQWTEKGTTFYHADWRREGHNLRVVLFASRSRLTQVEEDGVYL